LSFLQSSRMDLKERLKLHVKFEVALQAEGFASEPGVLQKVGKRFIRVSGQYIVPETMQEIVLLGVPIKVSGEAASVRTTYGGTFEAKLVRTGSDFLELLVARKEEEEELWLLIPLNKVISVEQL
jgi:hypothetical protein